MFPKLPLGSKISNDTGTPVALEGKLLHVQIFHPRLHSFVSHCGNAIWKTSCIMKLLVPTDMSVTVPLSSTLLPCTETSGEAETVVAWSFADAVYQVIIVARGYNVAVCKTQTPCKALKSSSFQISVPSVMLMQRRYEPRQRGLDRRVLS